MYKFLFMISVYICLCACSPVSYMNVNPSKNNQANFNSDSQYCNAAAQQASANVPSPTYMPNGGPQWGVGTVSGFDANGNVYCHTQGGLKPPPLGGGFSVSCVGCGHEQLSQRFP